MQYLDYSHSPGLVAISLCVSLMAGFTGLSLTQGLSEKSELHRKLAIAMASIALGGGIWSMHFVAMLGLQLPILYYYDAAITLMSALVAILVVGVALLLLHYRTRTTVTLVIAGVIVGMGIVAMHYIGMSGLELCRAVYTAPGVAIAVSASCILSVGAFWIAYGKRTHLNIVLGTVCFGFSVFIVHFVAVWNTRFVAVETAAGIGPLISNEFLAIGVVLSSFVICATFLLTSVTFLNPAPAHATAPVPQTDVKETLPEPDQPVRPAARSTRQIPYEVEGQTRFIDVSDVAVIRAEGHYTYLYTRTSKLFCIWAIKDAEARLAGSQFIKCHRSYLINPDHVSGFQRLKDNGICFFESVAQLDKVPVSRSMLNPVKATLGL